MECQPLTSGIPSVKWRNQGSQLQSIYISATAGMKVLSSHFSNYPGRWKVLHIKDKKEIGQSGLVGFDAIFNNCSGSGMTEYIIEIENCPGETALDALRKSADYLKAAPFVKAEY